MNTTTSAAPLRFGSIDDALGDREGRFFGEGFKRVAYEMAGVSITPAVAGTPGHVEATGRLALPVTWSRKGETDQRPHLSTIDAMLYAARLTGAYAGHTHGLGPEDTYAVRSLRIKAGSAPDEDTLGGFGVSADQITTTDLEGGTARTTAACRIGSMSARIEADHPAGARATTDAAAYETVEHLPGPWVDRPLGVEHTARRQLLHEVTVDLDALVAEADLELRSESEDEDEATMIDLFVSGLQLGQVLLYRLDDLDRAASNTLWMRSTKLETVAGDGLAAPDAGPVRFHTRLGQTALLDTDRGVWRTARIEATLGRHTLTCNVTHLLP